MPIVNKRIWRDFRMFLSLLLFIMLVALLFPGPFLFGGLVRADGNSTYAERYGVAQSHLMLYERSKMERQLEMLANAGVRWVRTGFAWCDLEPVRGAWRFDSSDRVVQKARSLGIEILAILGGPPGWANGGYPPNYPPTDIEAWKNYVRTVVSRYKGSISAYEIWNEENIHGFWMPSPSASDYVSLLRNTTPLIREADPGAKVIMGGLAGLDPSYMDACFREGIADLVDAVAFHPYPETLRFMNYTPQEDHIRFVIGWVRWLISTYTSKNLEIWLTEFGWTTCANFPPGVSEDTQASYILRSLINYAGTTADKIFYYNLWDANQNPGDAESNYGILRNDFSPKKSYHWMRSFISLFGRATSKSGSVSVSCSNPSTLEAHSFNLEDGSVALGVWKRDEVQDTAEIRVNAGTYDDPITLDPTTGTYTPVSNFSRDASGRITISGVPIGKDPVLVVFRNGYNNPPQTKPEIESINPSFGTAGSVVSITGSGFGQEKGSSVVLFGEIPATAYSYWSNDLIKAVVPTGLKGTVQVRVIREGIPSNSVQIEVFPPPLTIKSVSPNSANQFTLFMSVEINGTGFEKGMTVRLEKDKNVINGFNVNVLTDSKLTCTFGFFLVATGSYQAVVVHPDGRRATLPDAFTVRPLWF